MARPSKFTDNLADKICERLADGESMRSVCRDPKMPAMTTVFRWLRENDEFRQQYEVAKDEAADAMIEDIVDIADNSDSDNIQVDRLRVDVRKWAASKLKPKKYGDKQQIDMNASVNLNDLSDDDLDQELNQLESD